MSDEHPRDEDEFPGMGGPTTAGTLIARERELQVIRDALDAVAVAPRWVVLEGDAGVGKTAIWRRALEAATARGYRVLDCAPAESEHRLSFVALGDLVDPAIDEVLGELPAPQQRALRIALLRDEGKAEPRGPDRHAIGLAVVATLRALAARTPVVVAIDDLQWLDPPSAEALGFALRRLAAEPVAVLVTQRLEPGRKLSPELDRLLRDERVSRIRLPPLSLGAVHELLVARLSLNLPRPTIARLQETTAGNPFFALEIGRELVARGAEPAPDEPLPVPDNVRELVRVHLGRLRPRTRRVLLAAAALARPTADVLERAVDGVDAALAEATTAGVIEASRPRLRFTHPLLASVLSEDAPAGELRRVHARLAEAVDSGEERARHLALAAAGPDAEVASSLDAAALTAGSRGAPEAAADLCDLAVRLTPSGADRWGRLLAAAEYHHRAGSLAIAAARADEALAGAESPELRVRALALLGTMRADSDGPEAGVALYDRALREPGAPPALRADVHLKLAWTRRVGADARAAERHARAALRLAAGVDTGVEAEAAAAAALVAAVRGRAAPRDLIKRGLSLETGASGVRSWAWSETAPSALEGVTLLWAGEFEEARAPLERMHRRALEHDDPWLLMHALAYLSPLETALGRPVLGLELARRYLELAVASEQDAQRASALWPVAVAAIWAGGIDEARAAATEGVMLAERTGHWLYTIGNLGALGALELAAGRPAEAVTPLLRAWELARDGGIASLGRFSLLPDAVEALAAAGDVDGAAELAAELERLAQTLDRPWALALGARAIGQVAASRGEADLATDAFERALAAHAQQDRPPERARTLLAYGTSLRRQRRKRAAREALEAALAMFERMGATLWAERVRIEVGRIGGRQGAREGELTATQRAITELVAAGGTNREVADALHLSPRTVEWNLSRIYRKLGVRSRTELAAALGKSGGSTG